MCHHHPRVTKAPCSDAQGLALTGWALANYSATDRWMDGLHRLSQGPATLLLSGAGAARGAEERGSRCPDRHAQDPYLAVPARCPLLGLLLLSTAAKFIKPLGRKTASATFEHTRSPSKLSWHLRAHQGTTQAPPPTPRRTCWEEAEFCIIWSPYGKI